MQNSFTSILYPFAVDPGVGRLAEEVDYDAHIDQLIRQVLLTAPGERINRPDFGCGLKRLVFSPNNVVSASLAQVAIFQSLTQWLGDAITVNDVKAQAIEDRLEIVLAYTLKARQQVRYLNLEITP